MSQTFAYSTKGAADEAMTNSEIKMGPSKSLKLRSDFLNLSNAPDTETKTEPIFADEVTSSVFDSRYQLQTDVKRRSSRFGFGSLLAE